MIGYLENSSHLSNARAGVQKFPPRCRQHRNEPAPPSCRSCADLRREWELFEAERLRDEGLARSADARRRAQDRARAIGACPLCDGDGYIGTDLCTHAQASSSRPSLKALFDQAQAEKAAMTGGGKW